MCRPSIWWGKPSLSSSRSTTARAGGRSGSGRRRSAIRGSSPASIDELRALETLLGYSFNDPQLLERALTHASASADASNERLEFFGDRVLGLVIAEKLYELYPGDSEGALALKLNALVRQ